MIILRKINANKYTPNKLEKKLDFKMPDFVSREKTVFSGKYFF